MGMNIKRPEGSRRGASLFSQPEEPEEQKCEPQSQSKVSLSNTEAGPVLSITPDRLKKKKQPSVIGQSPRLALQFCLGTGGGLP